MSSKQVSPLKCANALACNDDAIGLTTSHPYFYHESHTFRHYLDRGLATLTLDSDMDWALTPRLEIKVCRFSAH